ncbi:MAG: tryptophan synthase subunit beta, partial [Planctomycetota bacterium]
AVETAHAVQYVLETAGARPADDHLVLCLSGRGDKDVYEVARLLGEEL